MEEKLKQKRSNCIKIVLFGPESTGKTTLSKELATHYNTEWVPEFARDYLQKKWDEEREVCSYEDLLPIAEGQILLENKASEQANRVLICDTDILETNVYSKAYFNGISDESLEKASIENQYDMYFLTYIDTPWEADDLRDRPNEREKMFHFFREALEKYKRPYVLLKGGKEERFKKATQIIDELIKR